MSVAGAITRPVAAGAALACLLAGGVAAAAEAPAPADSLASDAVVSAPVVRRADGLEPLVPELASHPYRLEPGVRPFRHRLTVSPGYGYLGREKLFVLNLGYNPDAWLGYEASIGHNPGEAVHAVLHTLTAVLRYPLPGRFQPYACGGYGMVMVYPGRSLNADPVTQNTLTAGGGLELYIRSDLALRADLRHATVFGKQRDRDGLVAYGYSQGTIGLAFHRSVRP